MIFIFLSLFQNPIQKLSSDGLVARRLKKRFSNISIDDQVWESVIFLYDIESIPIHNYTPFRQRFSMIVDQLRILRRIRLRDDEVFYRRLPSCEVVDRRIREGVEAILEEYLRLFVRYLLLHRRVRVRLPG